MAEADNSFPWSAGCAAAHTAQDAVGLLCWQSTLLSTVSTKAPRNFSAQPLSCLPGSVL